MNNYIFNELEKLKASNLYRKPWIIESAQADHIIIGGERYLNLCSNNYLGLADHSKLKEAALKATRQFGTGTGGSRLLCGTHKLHAELEEKIAAFKGSEAAIVFNSGYTANLGIITALAGRGDIVFSDKLNHASIVDAIKLSGAEFKRYQHNDSAHLAKLLKVSGPCRKKIIVSDSIFSMDGDIARIPEILELAQNYNCTLIIDDAHATGVLGKEGRGSLEYFDIKAQSNIIVMGTFSKALGSFGAFVCASKQVIDYLINKSRPFIYTTSLPPAVAAASTAAIDILNCQPGLRDDLWAITGFFRQGLNDLGFNTFESRTPIIPILIGPNETAVDFSRALHKNKIFAAAIRPPTVPSGSARIRISLMATHKKGDIEKALEIFKNTGKRLGVI